MIRRTAWMLIAGLMAFAPAVSALIAGEAPSLARRPGSKQAPSQRIGQLPVPAAENRAAVVSGSRYRQPKPGSPAARQPATLGRLQPAGIAAARTSSPGIAPPRSTATPHRKVPAAGYERGSATVGPSRLADAKSGSRTRQNVRKPVPRSTESSSFIVADDARPIRVAGYQEPPPGNDREYAPSSSGTENSPAELPSDVDRESLPEMPPEAAGQANEQDENLDPLPPAITDEPSIPVDTPIELQGPNHDEVPVDVGSNQDRRNDASRAMFPENEVSLEVPPLPDLGPTQPQPETELLLEEVLQSVEATFPLIVAAMQERASKEGKLLSAVGGFDLQLSATSFQQPLGFYENYRHSIGVEQQTAAWGTKVFGGYRLGTGNYPSYYQNRQTYSGGEFVGGVSIPLLRDGAIDKKRADLYKARYARQAAEPNIRAARIQYAKAASKAYWDWFEAGKTVELSRNLLELAIARDRVFANRVRLGATAPIERVDNRRVVNGRQAKVVAAERKFQSAQIKLSLYYRDDFGTPLLADVPRLPIGFPETESPDWGRLRSDGIELALRLRPELQSIQLERQMKGVELDLAKNATQPNLDLTAYGTQGGFGTPNSSRDRAPFQFETGVTFSVPMQRRAARGAIQEATADLTKLGAYLEYARNNVTNEVLDAVSAIVSAHDQIEYSRQQVAFNSRMEENERRLMNDGGASNIFLVNIRETNTFDSRQALLTDSADYFRAWAEYRAAVGLGGPADSPDGTGPLQMAEPSEAANAMIPGE